MAYGFNEDRSKAPVYTKEEIDQCCDRSYETVADMQADTTLTAGMIAHTLGFHSAGDGGAAWYEITDTGTANEMDVIECGELFANLITPEKMYPEIVGAWGDGVHDDTQFVSRAIYLSYTNNSRTTYFRKTYLITDTITISFANCTLINEKSAFTYAKGIVFNPENSKPLFEINNTGFNVNGLSLECMNKDTSVSSPNVASGYTCFYYNPTEISGGNENVDTFIFNCSISKFNYAFIAVGQNYTVKNCLFSECQFITYMQRADLNSRNWHFEQNRFHLIGSEFSISQCFRVTQGNINTAYVLSAFVIKDNIFDFCKELYLGSSNVVFAENYIRNPVSSTNPLIRILNQSNYKDESYNHESVFANNVYINNQTENIQGILLRVEQTNGIFISNNIVNFVKSYAFALVNCANLNIQNNVMYTGSDSNYCLTCVNAANGIANGNNCLNGKTYDGITNLEGVNYSNLESIA